MYRGFIIIFFFLCSCKNLDRLALYDIEIENTEGINGFTSTEIFSKGGGDEVWGMDDENCNPFSFSSFDASIDYSLKQESGLEKKNEQELDEFDRKFKLPTVKIKDRKRIIKNSIHLKTTKKPSCEWIGMGIGWDGWQGKDMSGIMTKSAIEFLIRVDKGSITNLPVVFILEDYSENQCYATANYLGIEGGEITTSWTKVTVPLQSFSYLKNKINLTNVKQLLMQCYDATDVYIDEIKIVKYENKYKRLEDNLTVFDSIGPITIFEDSLFSSWGINHPKCSNLSIKKSNGNTFIEVNTDSINCDWLEFGISWNNWLYTDISRSIKDLSLDFEMKNEKMKPFTISLEDYSGVKSSYVISEQKTTDDPKWAVFSIPLYRFPIKKSKINLTKIKQIRFEFAYQTKLNLDNIKLTKN